MKLFWMYSLSGLMKERRNPLTPVLSLLTTRPARKGRQIGAETSWRRWLKDNPRPLFTLTQSRYSLLRVSTGRSWSNDISRCPTQLYTLPVFWTAFGVFLTLPRELIRRGVTKVRHWHSLPQKWRQIFQYNNMHRTSRASSNNTNSKSQANCSYAYICYVCNKSRNSNTDSGCGRTIRPNWPPRGEV